MEVIKTKYPLNVLKDLQYFFTASNKLITPHQSILINKTKSTKFLLTDLSATFHFELLEISSAKPGGKGALLKLDILPAGPHTLQKAIFETNSADAIKRLSSWIEIVKEYNDIVINSEDEVLTSFEQEFETWFSKESEESDIYLTYPEQVIIEKSIIQIQHFVEQEDINNKEEITLQCGNLKNDLIGLTKGQVKKRLAKLFALLRKNGSKVLLKIYEAAVKDGAQRLVGLGFEVILKNLQ